jgi:hypothetical protein
MKSMGCSQVMKNFLRSSALLIGFLVASLWVAEGVLRHLFIEPIRIAKRYPFGKEIFGAHLTLHQREFSVPYEFNRYGFRDDDFPTTKEPDERRVLVLGDSFAEGVGVTTAQRFSAVLKEGLNQKKEGGSASVSVVNAGQIATQPLDYLHNLTSFGLALKPDLVVISIFTGNDFMGGRWIPLSISGEAAKRISEGAAERFPSREEGGMRLLANFLALDYLRGVVTQFHSPSDHPRILKRIVTDKFWSTYYGKEDLSKKTLSAIFGIPLEKFDQCTADVDPSVVEDTLKQRLNPCFLAAAVAAKCVDTGPATSAPYYAEEDFARTVKVIEAIRAILNARRIGYLFVVIPSINDVVPVEYSRILPRIGFQIAPPQLAEQQVLKERLLEVMKNEGISHIDLTESLKRLPSGGFYLFDTHLNPEGQRMVGESILKYLRDHSILS